MVANGVLCVLSVVGEWASSPAGTPNEHGHTGLVAFYITFMDVGFWLRAVSKHYVGKVFTGGW